MKKNISNIKVGDLVENVEHPYLDYRRVMAIGGGLLTLDFGGIESGLMPVKLFRKVETSQEPNHGN